jgi:hypothetical protein
MICVCVPPIKPLLNQWFPKVFASSGSNPNPSISFHLHDTDTTAEETSGHNGTLNKMRKSLRSFVSGSKGRASGSGGGDGSGRRETPWRDSKNAAGLGIEKVEGKEKVSSDANSEGIELSETDVSTKV